eukprot:14102506-Alexandrium_andersonii.AAC.1
MDAPVLPLRASRRRLAGSGGGSPSPLTARAPTPLVPARAFWTFAGLRTNQVKRPQRTTPGRVCLWLPPFCPCWLLGPFGPAAGGAALAGVAVRAHLPQRPPSRARHERGRSGSGHGPTRQHPMDGHDSPPDA